MDKNGKYLTILARFFECAFLKLEMGADKKKTMQEKRPEDRASCSSIRRIVFFYFFLVWLNLAIVWVEVQVGRAYSA